MTLETFFQKFDLLAEAPDAVPRLREIILELAVRGRLSERRAEDQNDPAWRAFREEIDNRIYASDPGPPPPFDVPDEWRWVTLSEAVDCRVSAKVPPNGIQDSDWILDLEDIDGATGTVLSRATFAQRRSQSTKAAFEAGDVLYGKLRPYLNKVVIADSRGFCTTEIVPLRPGPVVVGGFLRLFLRSPHFLRYAAQRNYGMKMPRLGTKDLESADFPLPPLAEQKRIVAMVEELMGGCDRLEAMQRKQAERGATLSRAALARFAESPTPANLQFLFHESNPIAPADIRKAILTLAVQGHLVPQDPNDEPAEEILAGLAADVAKAVRAKRMKNQRPIPAYQDEFPFDPPFGWAWAPLGLLTEAEDGAMRDGPFGSKLKTEHYIPTKGYAVLRLGNIGVGYFIHGKEGHISREHFESLQSNHTAPGDLLVAGLADPLVRCCEIPPDIGPAVNKSDCFRVRLSKRMDRSYVRHYLNSPIAKVFAAKENHGMTRERINLASAKALPVPVPPLAEQRRIVAKVDELMALVDELEAREAAARRTAESLLAALVTELASTPPVAPAPRAEPVELHTSPEFIRSVLAAEIVDRLHDDPHFGQVKFQKILYLAEYHFQLPEIESHAPRYAAGPHDAALIRQVEDKMREYEWFAESRRPGSDAHRYEPLSRAGAHRPMFEKLWPEQAAALRAFIDEMKSWKTERCERFATLYSAWNDLLHWGHEPTDAAILEQVLENWNPSKTRIPKSSWLESLQWMREHSCTPTGFGHATTVAPQAELPL